MNGSFVIVNETPQRQMAWLIGGNLFEVTTPDSGQLGVNPLWFILSNLKPQNSGLTILLLYPAVHMLLN